MTICKQCGKEKQNKEFPWLLQRVCHDCHMWNAMHWNEIPWQKSGSEAKRNAGRTNQLKVLRARSHNKQISTENEKTIQTTHESNSVEMAGDFSEW